VSRRGWALFVAMSLIWGIPYLLIKIAVEELSPVELVFLRTGISASCSCRGPPRGASWCPRCATGAGCSPSRCWR
jgi:drug/metabolite transporter (DMT)-like permease